MKAHAACQAPTRSMKPPIRMPIPTWISGRTSSATASAANHRLCGSIFAGPLSWSPDDGWRTVRRTRHGASGCHGSAPDGGSANQVAALLEKQQPRFFLLGGNVLECITQPVDVEFALNFSFCVFKERVLLHAYFKQIRSTLNEESVCVLNAYGSTEAVIVKTYGLREGSGFRAHVMALTYQASDTPGAKLPTISLATTPSATSVSRRLASRSSSEPSPTIGAPGRGLESARSWPKKALAKPKPNLHSFNANGESDDICRRKTCRAGSSMSSA